MTDPALAVGQWSIDGYVFGRNTDIEVMDLDDGGKPDANVGDISLPGEDGIRFGYDTLGPKTLTLEMLVNQYGAEEGRAAWRALSALWNGNKLRSTPGAVTYLRMNLEGNSGPLRVYGRPRKFEAVTSKQWSGINAGAIQIAADFIASDDKFYDDTESQYTFNLLPDTSGGFTWPITWPVFFTSSGEKQDTVRNEGNVDTWPVITFTGPVANPAIFYNNGESLRLNTSLTAGQSVTIDTRPWARTVLRENGGSIAGTLRGARLSEMALPPGTTEIGFRGTDATGLARCTVSFRSAFSTP